MSGVDLAQNAENQFNGVNCGIMDQFAIAMGKKDHAIFLDTAVLEYEYVPMEMGGYAFVIACSNKKRGLADSAYNTRRSECETALQELQQVVKVDTLGVSERRGVRAVQGRDQGSGACAQSPSCGL